MTIRLALAAALVCFINLQAQTGADIRGTVTDARDGHAIRHAQVTVDGDTSTTECNRRGTFQLAGLPHGTLSLQISAPGYRTVSMRVEVTGSSPMQVIAVQLVPSQFARVDTVSVSAFDRVSSDGVDRPKLELSPEEAENLGTVLADDPLRAVQALPGVSSNDDFEAQFSLRGEDFSRIGVYLDGVLLHDALHNLQGTDLSGSASVFDAALVGGMELYADARPQSLMDTSGSALQVHMRQADSDRNFYQLTANIAGAGFAAGGPLPKFGKCTWIGGFRKTYLQYLLSRVLTDPSMAFGLTDGQGQVNCLVNSKNSVSLEVVDSYTALNRTAVRTSLGANDVLLVGQHATETNLSWTYSPNGKTLITSHGAWMDDRFSAQNPAYEALGHGSYGEWAWNANAAVSLSSSNLLNLGGNVRSIHDGGFTETYDTVRSVELLNRYHGSDILASSYMEDSWSALRNRLRLTAGARWERGSTDSVSSYLPQAGLALKLTSSLRLDAGFGQYVQYPQISVLGSNLGGPNLLPARSTQASVALEQRILSGTSIRAEFYDRQDRDLLYQPYADPRVIGGAVFIPPLNPFYENSLRGYGRGWEISARRSMSRGITGWLSYAYGRSQMHDGQSGATFPSDYDQRHTVNAYASYRLRPSVNLSARWTYGSGFPVTGYLTAIGPVAQEDFYLTDRRNTLRIGPYQRLDLRMNKTWSHEKRKTTLYAEVTNLANKANYRFGSLDGYNSYTKSAYVTVDQMFPILPSVGVVFAW